MAINPKSLENLKHFPKGQSGNPGGSAASRQVLTARFLDVLAKDFQKDGAEAVKRCREEKPDAYIRAIAALCPKEIELKRPLEEMADSELLAALNALTGFIAARQSANGVEQATERASVN